MIRVLPKKLKAAKLVRIRREHESEDSVNQTPAATKIIPLQNEAISGVSSSLLDPSPPWKLHV
ncbi:hypothetical protein AKJ16_DCAP14786 [Drosera capensis]